MFTEDQINAMSDEEIKSHLDRAKKLKAQGHTYDPADVIAQPTAQSGPTPRGILGGVLSAGLGGIGDNWRKQYDANIKNNSADEMNEFIFSRERAKSFISEQEKLNTPEGQLARKKAEFELGGGDVEAPSPAIQPSVNVANAEEPARIKVPSEKYPGYEWVPNPRLANAETKQTMAPRLANWQDAIEHKKELYDLLFTKDPNTGEIKFKENADLSGPIKSSKYPFGKHGYEGQRINKLLEELHTATRLTRTTRGVGGVETIEPTGTNKAGLFGLLGSKEAQLRWKQNPAALYQQLESDYNVLAKSAKGVGGKIGNDEDILKNMGLDPNKFEIVR